MPGNFFNFEIFADFSGQNEQIIREPVQKFLRQDVYSVFVPTTPNPTSGYLLFVPKKDVSILNISVEEALKLVISGGSIVPSTLPEESRPVSINSQIQSKNNADESP